MKFRWFITKRHLVALIGLLVAALLLVLFTSCIPVTVRPQFDDAGLPVALPVTPVGSVSVDGTLTPIYPVSTQAPTAFNWAAVGAGIATVLSALLAAYGINVRGVANKAKAALQIACELADNNATAETEDQVRLAKAIAESKQMKAGVLELTQSVRGKT